MEKDKKKNNFSRADSTLIGNTDMNYQVNLSDSTYNILSGSRNITAFDFNRKKQQLVIQFRQPSNIAFPNGNSYPDKIWKEIYGIKDGELQLLETIEAKHTPGYCVDETIEYAEKTTEEDTEKAEG